MEDDNPITPCTPKFPELSLKAKCRPLPKQLRDSRPWRHVMYPTDYVSQLNISENMHWQKSALEIGGWQSASLRWYLAHFQLILVLQTRKQEWVYSVGTQGYPSDPCDVKWPSCWRATWGAWRGPGEWKQNPKRCLGVAIPPLRRRYTPRRQSCLGLRTWPKDGNMGWKLGICTSVTWRIICHSFRKHCIDGLSKSRVDLSIALDFEMHLWAAHALPMFLFIKEKLQNMVLETNN